MDIKVSLFASAVRIPFYKVFLDSLVGTTEKIEVVFCGPNTIQDIRDFCASLGVKEIQLEQDFFTDGMFSVFVYKEIIFKYLHSENIKPSQCYDAARRICQGETVGWSCDDAEHTPDLYGKAYRFWKEQDNEKLALSIQTEENGQYCNMKVHSFFGCQFHTPLMAPLALLSNSYLNKLGGYDRRYVCGQTENDCIMNLIADGGEVKIFGDRENKIILDHYRRHGIKRPFALGYNKDREILEASWTDGKGKVSLIRNDKHEPFESEGILAKTQSNNIPNQWV